MNTTLETKFLFDKIKRIYPTFEIPDEFDIGCWTDILKGYSQDEILQALKAYRKTVEYNTPPTPASFSKFLHQENGSPRKNIKNREVWDIDPALGYYLRDLETKSGKDVHALVFYRWALRDIIIEMVDTLPKSENMSFGEKVALLRKNNWDSDIDYRVEIYAKEALNNKGYIKGFAKNVIKKWKV